MPEIRLHLFQRKGIAGFKGKNLTIGAVERTVFMIREQIDPHGKPLGTPGIHRIYQYTPLPLPMIFNRTYDKHPLYLQSYACYQFVTSPVLCIIMNYTIGFRPVLVLSYFVDHHQKLIINFLILNFIPQPS
jgi:hypothetical protein